MRSGERPVDEETRIDIISLLEEFQASDEREMSFPPNLSNHDRAVVHSECKKYGFVSKSHGTGEGRKVHVYKPERAAKVEAFLLPFEDASLEAIQRHCAAHPPTADEALAVVPSNALRALGHDPSAAASAAAARRQAAAGEDGPEAAESRRRKRGAGAAAFPPETVRQLQAQYERRYASPAMADVRRTRESLPIREHREEIVSLLRSRQVILVAGETGCGKTTQVPQYILEDCWSRGEGCK